MRTVRLRAHSAGMRGSRNHVGVAVWGATIALVAAATLTSAAVAAQAVISPGEIDVTVRDSTGARIFGVELAVVGSAIRGFTNDAGQLRLAPVQPGDARITVRRLGFRPTMVAVAVAGGTRTQAAVQLVQVAQQLDPILVRGSAGAYGDRMAGFYDRLSHRSGHFITRTDIEKAQPSRLTDLFRRIPGIRIGSSRMVRDAVRMRGETGCAPLVWLDGAPAAAAEFDLDALVPESVEAIEVYNGLSEAPVQFMPPMDLKACGVIVIWSRRGEPRENRPRDKVSPAQLAELVDSLKVYTANEVDIPAHQDTSVHVVPVYPEAQFIAGTAGRVRAEFVVDTTGDVAMSTFSAISSTDPAFTASVRRAIAGASYVPAVLAGRRVRQVVHQPFRFVVDHGQPAAAVPRSQ